MLESAVMPTDDILSLLIAQRERINRAIEALQTPMKRRGRPPKAVEMNGSAEQRRRAPRSAAQKRAQSERMKKYWAQRRRQEKA